MIPSFPFNANKTSDRYPGDGPIVFQTPFPPKLSKTISQESAFILPTPKYADWFCPFQYKKTHSCVSCTTARASGLVFWSSVVHNGIRCVLGTTGGTDAETLISPDELLSSASLRANADLCLREGPLK
jgi:hypothetical protein